MNVDSPHTTSAADNAHVNINRIDISERTISIIALVIAAIALGMAIMLPKLQEARLAEINDRAWTASQEARVSQERWNDLKVELARRGIPVSDH